MDQKTFSIIGGANNDGEKMIGIPVEDIKDLTESTVSEAVKRCQRADASRRAVVMADRSSVVASLAGVAFLVAQFMGQDALLKWILLVGIWFQMGADYLERYKTDEDVLSFLFDRDTLFNIMIGNLMPHFSNAAHGGKEDMIKSVSETAQRAADEMEGEIE